MSQVIVKTNRQDHRNLECCLPGVGDVLLNEHGEFEIDNDQGVAKLLKSHTHFYVKGEEVDHLTSQVESNDLKKEEDVDVTLKAQVESTEPLTELTSEEEKQIFIESLSTKSRKELEELCKSFPGGEWRGKNKEQMAEYLKEKALSAE